jgi:outer membrane protein assembly factor BamE (lipoprotein component of BamABCDE complex)
LWIESHVKTLLILIAVTAFVGVVALLFAFVPRENYNFMYPSIDTTFAPGYSERAFSQVTNGMSASVVTQLLGKPLFQGSDGQGTEMWSYSTDGKCSWGDFAWLSRVIKFRNDRVILVEKTIYYN